MKIARAGLLTYGSSLLSPSQFYTSGYRKQFPAYSGRTVRNFTRFPYNPILKLDLPWAMIFNLILENKTATFRTALIIANSSYNCIPCNKKTETTTLILNQSYCLRCLIIQVEHPPIFRRAFGVKNRQAFWLGIIAFSSLPSFPVAFLKKAFPLQRRDRAGFPPAFLFTVMGYVKPMTGTCFCSCFLKHGSLLLPRT